MNIGLRDTINIDESVHEIYKELTEGNDSVTAPFKTMKDVFLWAVCLGLRDGSRKKLIGKRMTIFRWAQFNQEFDVPVVKAISLVEENNIDVLIDREKTLTIIEEYANDGIHSLADNGVDNSAKNLWKLVETINC